ncbi:MAG: ABC transporter ATP-binding protein [Bacteroidales bacterium]|jgi:putative ABC transport system ATP-binding protein|nr:ABC transporter ATP-binding protein [Bacteroidales bacterium]MDX9927956.1 ABC transporter ATP-binding protein [Bacteroidales bacterium]HNX83242.1 ABC transporter ATP-binding protein [Bacteroidales bacterium]HOC48516.1 ABC transporter ATP-binding protein [Bacteroidales bacterium]HPS97542.1 ABC transporter ATP-binding protein [Bacteroidales bacterium]
MNVVEINDVYKTYHDTEVEVRAVNGVTLSFTKGDFAVIVGPSGSGKTTLLNLIGGLDQPTTGEIIVAGHRLSELKPSELIDFRMEHVGFVFQSYNLIPVLTAAENVGFIMSLQKWPKEKRMARTGELLEAVGLADRHNSRPSQLSGGQQQRVAVARALAPRPEFILADEPTANLDSKSAETLLDIMEKLNREEEMTFIFSTHDARVMKRARRVITLEDGKVVSDERTNHRE